MRFWRSALLACAFGCSSFSSMSCLLLHRPNGIGNEPEEEAQTEEATGAQPSGCGKEACTKTAY